MLIHYDNLYCQQARPPPNTPRPRRSSCTDVPFGSITTTLRPLDDGCIVRAAHPLNDWCLRADDGSEPVETGRLLEIIEARPWGAAMA